MSIRTIGIGSAFIALAFFIQPGWSADTETMKTMKAGKWKIMAHLQSIPKEHREMAKATHHVSFIVTDEKGNQITDGKVSFEFVLKGKVVASGEAKYMGGMAMSGHAMQGGHYGADLTLPGGGLYILNVTVTAKGATQKASTQLNAPQ